MSLLTKQERDAIEEANKYEGADGWEWDLDMVITAIEAAVIRKLATVGVEPCAWEVETEQQDGTRAKWVSTDRKRHREFCDFGEPRQLYSQEAIAAARVQALEFLEFCWRDVSMNEYSFDKLNERIAAIKTHLGEHHGN